MINEKLNHLGRIICILCQNAAPSWAVCRQLGAVFDQVLDYIQISLKDRVVNRRFPDVVKIVDVCPMAEENIDNV